MNSTDDARATDVSRPQVLVVDDSPVQRRILEACLLEHGFEPLVAKDGEEALAASQRPGAPRLMILDWELPGMSGIEVCRSIRMRKGERYTYIVILTAKSEAERVVAALQAGADDFIHKPFDPAELTARLATGCRILQLEQQLVSARDELHRLAMYDGLTGLLNRAAILDYLGREIARANRQQVATGVMMLDLDYFKGINDSFGHMAGDQVLKEVGDFLRSNFRSYDAAGRVGGEEFLVVLPSCGYPDLNARAEMTRQSIAALGWKFDGRPCSLTVSIGITALDPTLAESFETLLRRADSALYEAKHYGRNRIVGRVAQP